ncbi:hypothetical protein [Paenibacillus alvei]|uniref:hypothetical protein n=1 Tax=Paenibacillus alvei TaxID=44250 RepID=UPI0013DA1FFB|nr:hypothetical protein [Paenibacillus alvei]NEZ42882.1 hypothetical protein [Paenibacillus alvei]
MSLYSDYPPTSIRVCNLEFKNPNIINDELLGEYWLVEKRCRASLSIVTSNYRAKKTGLVSNLNVYQWRTVFLDIFDSRCPFTKRRFPDYRFNLGHAIPINWIQGGSYFGNVFPIYQNMNESMRDIYIFYEDHFLSDEDYERFVTLLASMNNLTVSEYLEFYDNAFENKRMYFSNHGRNKFIEEGRTESKQSLSSFNATHNRLLITKRCMKKVGRERIIESLNRHNANDWGDCLLQDVLDNQNAAQKTGVVKSNYRTDDGALEYFIFTDIFENITVIMHRNDL